MRNRSANSGEQAGFAMTVVNSCGPGANARSQAEPELGAERLRHQGAIRAVGTRPTPRIINSNCPTERCPIHKWLRFLAAAPWSSHSARGHNFLMSHSFRVTSGTELAFPPL